MIKNLHTHIKLLHVFHKFFTAKARMFDGLGTRILWTEETSRELLLQL